MFVLVLGIGNIGSYYTIKGFELNKYQICEYMFIHIYSYRFILSYLYQSPILREKSLKGTR